MSDFFQNVLEHLPFYLIPFVSGVVGWATNVIALKMTFYPLEFVGIRPFFGWQGIIPSKAVKMAGISVHLMTTKLIKISEVFARLEPKITASEMSPGLKLLSRQIIDEVMDAQASLAWKGLPANQKEAIYKRVEKNIPAAVESMMRDMKNNIDELLDLKRLVIDVLLDDKALINEIFLNVGDKEFKFIERSGLYFGFLFGLIQMGVFYFYSPWWILPVFGLIVGFATNWLAIKLIFNPVYPVNVLGLFKLQGVFIKRQLNVAAEYARIISERILTTERLFDYILRGPNPERFQRIIRKYTDEAVDHSLGDNKEWWEIFADKRIKVARNITFYRFKQEFPIAIRDIFPYASVSLQIEKTLREKMSALSELEFVEFLRPVFQEDEFKLILVGAFLGGLAGLAQFYLFFN